MYCTRLCAPAMLIHSSGAGSFRTILLDETDYVFTKVSFHSYLTLGSVPLKQWQFESAKLPHMIIFLPLLACYPTILHYSLEQDLLLAKA